MAENVEVRIRREADTKAVLLCSVPFSEIDDVIPQLASWSVYDSEEGYSFGHGQMVGQFVIPGSGPAYFEIVVGLESE